MIIIEDEENIIVEMFDSAKELKEYIDNYLHEVENGLNKDCLLEDNGRQLLAIPLDKAEFALKLNSYQSISGNKVIITGETVLCNITG